MFHISDEFEFEFEKVICTDLLLWDHKNSSTVRKIRFILQADKELKAELKGLKNSSSDLWYLSHPNSTVYTNIYV